MNLDKHLATQKHKKTEMVREMVINWQKWIMKMCKCIKKFTCVCGKYINIYRGL